MHSAAQIGRVKLLELLAVTPPIKRTQELLLNHLTVSNPLLITISTTPTIQHRRQQRRKINEKPNNRWTILFSSLLRSTRRQIDFICQLWNALRKLLWKAMKKKVFRYSFDPISYPQKSNFDGRLFSEANHQTLRSLLCRVLIEFCFYFNFNLLPKVEATCSIDRIIKFGCNLIARKILASTKVL